MKRITGVLFIIVMACGLLFGYTDEYNKLKQIYDANRAAEAAGAESGAQRIEVPGTEGRTEEGIFDFKNAREKKKMPETAVMKEKEEIVVTAREVPETIGTVPRGVSIIKAKKAGSKGFYNMEKLLSARRGMNIRKYGPFQGLASLSLRGAPSKHTLVLIDGIPANDLFTGDVDLSLFDLAGAEKVEIVRGGLSSIYGAGAVAGVINVLSGFEDKKWATLSTAMGSYNTQRHTLSSVNKIFNVDYSASVSEEKSDGYTENSAFQKRAVRAKVHFGKSMLDSIASGYYVKRDKQVPFNQFGPTPNQEQVNESYVMGLEENVNLNYLILKIKGHIRSDDFKIKNPDIGIDDRHLKKESEVSGAMLYEEGKALKGILSFEFRQQDIDSTKTGEKTATNSAVIANVSSEVGENLVAGGGGRIDTHSEYGSMTSESFSAKYRLDKETDVFASVEQAFSAPTLGDLYWNETLDFGGFYTSETKGDTALKPETSVSYEVGISRDDKKLKETVTWFRRDVKDMISWKTETDFSTYDKNYPVNIDTVRIIGVEASAELIPFEFISLAGQYSHLNVIDYTGDYPPAYTPEDRITGQLVLNLPFGTGVAFNGEYTDYRFHTDGTLMKEYYVFGGHIEQQVNDNIKVFMDVDNIFDQKYMVIKSNPMAGRTVMAGTEVSF